MTEVDRRSSERGSLYLPLVNDERRIVGVARASERRMKAWSHRVAPDFRSTESDIRRLLRSATTTTATLSAPSN